MPLSSAFRRRPAVGATASFRSRADAVVRIPLKNARTAEDVIRQRSRIATIVFNLADQPPGGLPESDGPRESSPCTSGSRPGCQAENSVPLILPGARSTRTPTLLTRSAATFARVPQTIHRVKLGIRVYFRCCGRAHRFSEALTLAFNSSGRRSWLSGKSEHWQKRERLRNAERPAEKSNLLPENQPSAPGPR